MASSEKGEYWYRTKRLMIVCMVVWFFFSFAIHIVVDELNTITIIGFPLGFWMASQGALIAFVILIFWFSSKQDQIDRECGVAEE